MSTNLEASLYLRVYYKLIVQGDFDVIRFASTLKTEKKQGPWDYRVFPKRMESITILIGTCDFMTPFLYILTLHVIVFSVSLVSCCHFYLGHFSVTVLHHQRCNATPCKAGKDSD